MNISCGRRRMGRWGDLGPRGRVYREWGCDIKSTRHYRINDAEVTIGTE